MMFQTAAMLYKFLAAKYVAAAMAVLGNGLAQLDNKLTQLFDIKNVNKKISMHTGFTFS
jgi:hypothetical protein